MERPTDLVKHIREEVSELVHLLETDIHYFNDENKKKNREIVRKLLKILKISNDSTKYESVGEYKEVYERLEEQVESDEELTDDKFNLTEEKYYLVLYRLKVIYEEYYNEVPRGQHLLESLSEQEKIGGLLERIDKIVTIYCRNLWLQTDYIRTRVEQVIQVELRKKERNGAYIYITHQEREEIVTELKHNPYLQNVVENEPQFKRIIEDALIEYGLSKEYVLEVTKEDRREIIESINEGVKRHLRLQDRVDGEEDIYVSDITMLLNSTELKAIKEKQLKEGGQAEGYESHINKLVTNYFTDITKETSIEREEVVGRKGNYPLLDKYKGIGGKYRTDIEYMVTETAITTELHRLYRSMEETIASYPKELIKLTDEKIRLTQTGTELYKTMLMDSVPSDLVKITEKDITRMLKDNNVDTVYERSQAMLLQKLLYEPIEELGAEVIEVIEETRETIEDYKKKGEDNQREVSELLYALYEILSDTIIELVLMDKAERIERNLETYRENLYNRDYGRRATSHEIGNIRRMYELLMNYVEEHRENDDKNVTVTHIICYNREEDIKTRQDLHINVRIYYDGDIYEIVISPYYVVDVVTGGIVFTKTSDYYEYILESYDDIDYMGEVIRNEVTNLTELVSQEIRIERK